VSVAEAGGSIRRRVVRTLALPVAAVVLLLAIVAATETRGYRKAADSAKAVTLGLAVQDLAQELQTERGLAAGLLGGNAGFRAELTPARQRVDRQRERLEKLAGQDAALGRTVKSLDGLAAVRAGTDQGVLGRPAAFAFYTDRIAELNRLDTGLDKATDPQLRKRTAALQALGDAKESMAQERAFLNGVFSAGGFRDGEFLQFVTMRAAKDASLNTFRRYATRAQQASADYVFGTGASRTAGYFEQVALGSGDGQYLQVNPQSWWSSLTTVLDDMLRLGQHIGDVVRQRAAQLKDQAARRMAVLALVALLCFGGSAYLAIVASRSIARPLATLAADADRLAADRLPDAVKRATAGVDDEPPPRMAVPPGASDEVRSVADALDRVQATAYALATEQAQLRRSTGESLADLGRRNQNLVRRQLGFITRLESEESDPAGLANLFELDHLATRMRRNAESLLVLVGAASPRQWSEPVPVADVIRAAVSEVEEYRRVTLRRVDEAMLSGTVVSGVAHMLAELVENGLSFSSPDVDVEIQGRLFGDRYLIAVIDQGIGLSADELAEANHRLRGDGDFLVAPARFLGHYVVGRLARDLGVGVELTPSPVTGTTARLFLPAELLATPMPLTAPQEIREPRQIHQPQQIQRSQQIGQPPEISKPTVTVEYVPILPLQRVPSGEGDPSRTANGLPRRAPRTHRAEAMPQVFEAVPAPETDPDEVRARLTAFRSGVHRGSA
jgi:hypothetical protein